MIVTLVGYRGTGKSSVAPALAAALGYSWVDADRELEHRAGRSIRAIFDSDGEAEFRRLERETLVSLLQRPDLVLAAGGGAILRPETRQDFRAAGPVVWLQAEIATVLERLQADSRTAGQRPSLTGLPWEQEVAALMEQRRPWYAEVATLSVATDHRSVNEIVAEILEKLPGCAPPAPQPSVGATP